MNTKDFDKLINKQILIYLKTLKDKGKEYGDTEDRLAHFKKAAALMGTSPEQALMGMLTKHIVSISEMAMSSKTYDIEKWDEKIGDAVNYLLLLGVVLRDEK